MNAREVLAAYAERINRQDFNLLTDLIAADATFWFTNGTYVGIAAIRNAFESTWQLMGSSEVYWLDQQQWIAESDGAAACTYRFNWKTDSSSGAGRGTTVLRFVDNRWWIVHEHLSRWPA